MIHVYVLEPDTEHRCYRLRWRDPDGQKHTKSSGTTSRRDAERAAGLLEEKLNSGQYAHNAQITWEAFWDRCKAELLPSKADKTAKAYTTAANALTRLVVVRRLADLTTSKLSQFAAKLRHEKKSEDTIKSYLGSIQALLAWAVDVRLLGAAPALPKIQRAKKTGGNSRMKGRPLSEAEFERMIQATPLVVGQMSAPSWQHWLRGLWLSGLRLEESLNLWWDREDMWSIDLSGEYPMLRVPRHLEKGFTDRLLPIAPEFGDFLLAVPERDRHGPVFRLAGVQNPSGRGRTRTADRVTDADWVSRIGSRIGRKAGVAVDTSAKGRVKYASAHDLRRSFGTRWAMKVQPPVLQVLMRHEDIKTTMRYYVQMQATEVARAVYAASRPLGGALAQGPDSGPDSGKSSKASNRSKRRKSEQETS
jgi:integrase